MPISIIWLQIDPIFLFARNMQIANSEIYNMDRVQYILLTPNYGIGIDWACATNKAYISRDEFIIITSINLSRQPVRVPTSYHGTPTLLGTKHASWKTHTISLLYSLQEAEITTKSLRAQRKLEACVHTHNQSMTEKETNAGTLLSWENHNKVCSTKFLYLDLL